MSTFVTQYLPNLLPTHTLIDVTEGAKQYHTRTGNLPKKQPLQKTNPQQHPMLESLITNKTRLKLLLKFFLNKNATGYLRNLESEFGESSNAIRVELNRFEEAGLLSSSFSGNKKFFQANTEHPLYDEINSILRKTVGIDKIVESIVSRIGELKEARITGDLAQGNNSSVIDLLLIGGSIDKMYVASLIEKVEQSIQRKIRFLIISEKEKEDYLDKNPSLLIWKA